MLSVPLADGSGSEQRVGHLRPDRLGHRGHLGATADVVLPDVLLPDSDGQEWHVQRDLVSSGTNRDVVIEVDDAGIGVLRFGRESTGLPANGQPPCPGTRSRRPTAPATARSGTSPPKRSTRCSTTA